MSDPTTRSNAHRASVGTIQEGAHAVVTGKLSIFLSQSNKGREEIWRGVRKKGGKGVQHFRNSKSRISRS